MNSTLSFIGMLIAFGLLVFMMMKGVDLFLTVMAVVTVVIITSGLNPYETFINTYMSGFVGYYKNQFFLFLVGAMFGKIMEISGGATSIAKWIIGFAKGNAWISIPIASGLLAYGGVYVFVVMFATLPIALAIFKEHDISRRLLPATLYFGSCTFAMVGPGTPQVQNIVPCTGFGQTLMCGTVGGFVGIGSMAVIGCIWLGHMIKTCRANGEHFHSLPGDVTIPDAALPSPVTALIPLIATVVIINLSKDGVNLFPVEVSVLLGTIIAIICLHKHLNLKELPKNFMGSVNNTAGLIFNISTMVGFGAVVKVTDGFQWMVDWVVGIPGPYLIGAAVGATLICGLCGSASGGLGIATPIFAEVYTNMPGANLGYIARIMALGSSALDSMPHSGSIVTIIKLCGMDHKQSYLPCFYLSVVVPAIGTVIAIVVFQLFPFLP